MRIRRKIFSPSFNFFCYDMAFLSRLSCLTSLLATISIAAVKALFYFLEMP
ncbi:hypothetical protein NEOC84_000398|nr:hypothetical protein [Neochlamydia sp. AcF84]